MNALAQLAQRRLSRIGATPNHEAIEDANAIREGGFGEFMRRAWSRIETDRMIWNWHHDALVEHLTAVYRGEILTLVINVPPGHTKSLTASVFWPAWIWLPENDPTWRTIAVTYDRKLSHRDARRVKSLIDSAWWRQRWPSVQIPSSASRSIGNYANTSGGWRISTTPGGMATGWHADGHIYDDLIKPKDTKKVAGSGEAAQLESVRQWLFETMPTRARTPAALRRVLIMQRLHEKDPAGAMIEAGGCEVLVLPARFEKHRACKTYVTIGGSRAEFFEDPRTREGELLYPQRFPETVVSELEGPNGLGPEQAAAQLQQRPDVAGGAVFKLEWLNARRYDVLPSRGFWAMSVDARFKDDQSSGDKVAIGVWFVSGTDFYRVDEIFDRLSFTETCDAIRALRKKYPRVRRILIENKANGPAIENTLRKEFPGIVLVEPLGGKIARARATTGYWRAGNVWLPQDADWVPEYVENHRKFPRAKFDDQVDETSQALLDLADHTGSSMIEAMKKLKGGAA